MKTLIKLTVVLAVAACSGGTGSGGTGGGGSGGGSGAGGGGGTQMQECFAGTPTTNDELMNACTDQSVEKILKQTSWRDPGTVLPALP